MQLPVDAASIQPSNRQWGHANQLATKEQVKPEVTNSNTLTADSHSVKNNDTIASRHIYGLGKGPASDVLRGQFRHNPLSLPGITHCTAVAPNTQGKGN